MSTDILHPGFCIKSTKGTDIKIISTIGSGFKSTVYLISYGEEKMALKWYNPSYFHNDLNTLYLKMEHLVHRGKICSTFLSPVDITPVTEGSFGVVFDLIPAGYYELTDFLRGSVYFSSHKILVDAALDIVNAFRVLSCNGYTYQSIDDTCFYINPETGNVIILDNDNIHAIGEYGDILGSPKYLAPEVVAGKAKPDRNSNLFSLAVILFELMCHAHPLEGKRSLGIATPEMQQMLYGNGALFIFDRNNTENSPDERIHFAAIKTWQLLPCYIKELFYHTFEKEYSGLHNPELRVRESEWLLALTRFRSDIIKCSCGNEVFIQNIESCKCENCGNEISIPFIINARYCSIPCIPGSRVYRCQIESCDIEKSMQPVAKVIRHSKEHDKYGVMNMTPYKWRAVLSSGTEKEIHPKEVIPLIDDITVYCFNGSFTISAKKR